MWKSVEAASTLPEAENKPGWSPAGKEIAAMEKKNTEGVGESRVVWENLETMTRQRIQGWLQDLLESEVAELLGRGKSERRRGVDASRGYRNGHGKPRNVTLSAGTITIRRPRIRSLDERFESRVLPLFERRTKEVNALIPELYLHGLAEGDFDLALRGLLGEEAPISASTVARLKEKWRQEWGTWNRRSLKELEVVYLWVDGVYVKAGLEKEKAAVLVVLGGLSDGRKEILAVVPGHRESTESWASVLRDLKSRGMSAPKLVIGDGHLGIWGGLRNVYPEAEEQRCWNHRIVNVLDKLPKKLQAEAKGLLSAIPYRETIEQAEAAKSDFIAWCQQHGQDKAGTLIEHDWERLVAFYRFPKDHWVHIRTTNPIESPFASLRIRTDAARRFKKVDNATAVVWKLLLIAEKRFRRLNSPELLKEVYAGTKFRDGLMEKKRKEGVLAA